MSRIGVVAAREIRQGLANKSIVISTLFTIAVIAAIVLLPDLLGFGGASQQRVAVTGGGGERLLDAARRGQEAFGVELQRVGVESADEARALIDEGEVDAAILDDGRRIVAADGAADGALGALQAAGQRRQTVAALEREGLSPAAIARVLDPPAVPVERQETGNGQGIAMVALFLLYGQLIGYGFVVAAGIVEEKSSRVIELLLSVLSPRELLAGKVLGIGVVGLAQLVVISLAGLAIGAASGAIELDGEAWSALAVVVAWFLLGYAFFSAAFSVAGALVPRQEDLQAVTTPLTIVLVAVFVLSFPAIDDPGGQLARTLSFLPFSAPLIMPGRIIAGDVAAWEILAAIASTAAGTALLVLLAGRVYRAAALETRAAIGLRSALKRA
jgi:ABC-2 type transport system permease protein